MNKVYEQAIWTKGISWFGKDEEWVRLEIKDLPDLPLIKSFLEDDDIQQIKIVSTNIGFVRDYQKRYKKNENKAN